MNTFFRKSRKVTSVIAFLGLLIITASAAEMGVEPGNEPLHEITFEYDVDKIIVPVKVNGSETIRCILDTGMPEGIFIMNPEAAKPLKLEYVSTAVPIGGAGGGTETASMAMGAFIEMAGVEFEQQRVIVKNKVDHISRTDWVGVIGASVFSKFVVEIDTEKEILRLYDPTKYDPKAAGEALDLTITRTKPYIMAPVNIDGQKDVPIKVVVDTGASSGLIVSAKSSKGFKVPAKSIEGIFGAGVGGDVTGNIARVKSFSLGKHVLNDVVTLFRNGPVPAGADGLIGMKVMERFLVTFDYVNKKMYVKPNGRIGEPFEFSMIGVSLQTAEKDGMNVVDVFKGSPAAEAGLQKGDLVTAFNGKDATFDLWSEIANTFRTPGMMLKISWMRDGKKFEKEIVSKRLI